MRATIVAVVALALAPLARSEAVFENPRFCSPSGEFCVVLRHYPRIGDFDRVPADEYRRTDPIDDWLEQYPAGPPAPPPPPEPARAAVYRRWPSGNQELLYELTRDSDQFLVADDGFVVSYRPVHCDKKAQLLTVHAPDGSARTLHVQDVFTRHDQLWLCRGRADDVRWSFDSTLQATVLVTDTRWDDPESRFASLEIDPANDHLPAPARDLCPDAVRIEALPDAVLPPALHRQTPDYPEVAIKARVAGTVRARLLIGNDGTVQSVTITKPIPFGIDEAVRTALLQWIFHPPQEPLIGEIAFRFEILRNPVVMTTTIRH